VQVRVNGTVVAKGASAVDGTGAFDVTARPTAAGRRLLSPARALRGTVQTSLAGTASVRSTLALRAS
jgi:hypothetical protein